MVTVPMIAYLREQLYRRMLFLLCAVAMVIAGVGGNILGKWISSMLGLTGDAEMYVMLATFLMILAGAGWAYDKYREWRFLRSLR